MSFTDVDNFASSLGASDTMDDLRSLLVVWAFMHLLFKAFVSTHVFLVPHIVTFAYSVASMTCRGSRSSLCANRLSVVDSSSSNADTPWVSSIVGNVGK